MKKITIAVVTVAMLVVATWLGASFYSARISGNYVTSLPEMYQQQDFIHIKTIEHQQSAFSSEGKFELRMPNVFAMSEEGQGALGFVVQYSISNLLLPKSAGRVTWQLIGDDAIDTRLTKLFGQGAAMHGHGIIQYDGKRRSSVELAELVLKDGDAFVQMTPVKGNLDWDNLALHLQLKTDRLNARAEGSALDWQGIALDVNLSDRMQGLGVYTMSADKGSSDGSSFEKMTLIKNVSLSNDRLNVSIAQTIKSYVFDQYRLNDIDQSFRLNNMDFQSVQTISSILRDAKDLRNMTLDERTKLTTAVRQLIDQGFSVALPKIAAKMDSGSIEGEAKVEILKSEGSVGRAFSTAQRVNATGQLQLKGRVLDPAQTTTAVLLGLAIPTPDGLKSAFDFSEGVIKINGRAFDIKEYLTYSDNVINSLLAPQ
ncbi:DUF945 family protein [Zwartia sp.]|uniref:DUF945 family protein n=1 Tax=Zwartia sp. TaxID=2978004 RepID=UPI00272360F1|nr:DUF945 family protein [Zwartia sp.]MDO9025510.1 DUF945 family protein [Zwartia sp.]